MNLPVQFLRQRRDIVDRGNPPKPSQTFSLQEQEQFCDHCASHPDDPKCSNTQGFCSRLSASLATATSTSSPSASNNGGAPSSVSGSDSSPANPTSSALTTNGTPSSSLTSGTDPSGVPSPNPTTNTGAPPVATTVALSSLASDSLPVVSGSQTGSFSLAVNPTVSLPGNIPSSAPLIAPTGSSSETTKPSTAPVASMAQSRLAASHPVSAGAIVGIIVGVVALVLAVGAILTLRRRRRLRQIAPSQEFMWRTTSAPGSINRAPSRQNLSLNLGTDPEMAAVAGGVASRSASPYAQSQTRSYESPTAGPSLGPPPLHAVGFGESQYGDAYRSNSPYGGFDGLNSYIQSQPADSNPYIDPPGSNNPYIDRSRSNNPYLNPSASATNPFANPNPTSNPFASPYGTPAGSREHLRRPTLDSELL